MVVQQLNKEFAAVINRANSESNWIRHSPSIVRTYVSSLSDKSIVAHKVHLESKAEPFQNIAASVHCRLDHQRREGADLAQAPARPLRRAVTPTAPAHPLEVISDAVIHSQAARHRSEGTHKATNSFPTQSDAA